MSKGIVEKALDNPIGLAVGVGLILGIVYFLGRKLVSDAAAVANGVVSGNNALTAGTPYQGAGVVGTVAAAADSAAGGSLSSIGDAIGSWFYDVTHTEYDPNSGLQTGAKTVRDGAVATDKLWGSIGSVSLRAQ